MNEQAAVIADGNLLAVAKGIRRIDAQAEALHRVHKSQSGNARGVWRRRQGSGCATRHSRGNFTRRALEYEGICVTPDWLYWHGDAWHESEQKLLGLKDHSFWMGNSVFDGARAYEGLTPDLDLHCARAVRSALSLSLKPQISAADLTELCREGVARFAKDDVLYI